MRISMIKNLKMYFHYLKKPPGETIKVTPSLLVIITLQAITLVAIAWKKMKATLLLFSGALLIYRSRSLFSLRIITKLYWQLQFWKL